MLVWQAHKGKIESVAFSPDGRLLVTATGGTRSPYIWEPTSGTLLRKLEGASGVVKSVCFAPDASLLAAGTAESVTLWRTDTWEVLGELKMRHAQEITFGPGEPPEFVASNSDRIDSWTAATRAAAGAEPRPADGTYSAPRNNAAVHLSADGKWLVTSTYNAADLWHTADRKHVRSFRSKEMPTRGAVRFAPDSRRVAITYGKWAEVWPVSDEPGPLLKIGAGSGRSPLIWSVNWTADGRALLTAGNDEHVRAWHADTGAELKSFRWGIGKLYCVALSPDGLTCAAGGETGQVVVWDVDS